MKLEAVGTRRTLLNQRPVTSSTSLTDYNPKSAENLELLRSVECLYCTVRRQVLGDFAAHQDGVYL